jgi:hypothetical protein
VKYPREFPVKTRLKQQSKRGKLHGLAYDSAGLIFLAPPISMRIQRKRGDVRVAFNICVFA